MRKTADAGTPENPETVSRETPETPVTPETPEPTVPDATVLPVNRLLIDNHEDAIGGFNTLKMAADAGYLDFIGGAAYVHLARFAEDGITVIATMPAVVSSLAGLTDHQAKRLADMVDPDADARKAVKKLKDKGYTAEQIAAMLKG